MTESPRGPATHFGDCVLALETRLHRLLGGDTELSTRAVREVLAEGWLPRPAAPHTVRAAITRVIEGAANWKDVDPDQAPAIIDAPCIEVAQVTAPTPTSDERSPE